MPDTLRALGLSVLTYAQLSCAGVGEARQSARGVVYLDTCERAVHVVIPLFGGRQAPTDSALLTVRVSNLEMLARIPDATIVLMTNSIEVIRVRTDANGEADVRVPPGPYRLEVHAIGFQVTRADVVLQATGYSPIELPVWTRPVC